MSEFLKKPKYYIVKSENKNVLNYVVFNTETCEINSYLVGVTPVDEIIKDIKENGDSYEVITIKEDEKETLKTVYDERENRDTTIIKEYIAEVKQMYRGSIDKSMKRYRLIKVSKHQKALLKQKQTESELPAKYNKKLDLEYDNSIKELPKQEVRQDEIQCKSH